MIHAVGYSWNLEKILENSKTKFAIQQKEVPAVHVICDFQGSVLLMEATTKQSSKYGFYLYRLQQGSKIVAVAYSRNQTFNKFANTRRKLIPF